MRALTAVLHALAVLLGVLTLVFLLLHTAPGDPVDILLGEHAGPANRERLREALGLDGSLILQWLRGIAALATGDWGEAIHARRPVLTLIGERLQVTALLAFGGLAGGLLMGVPVGLVAGLAVGRWPDRLLAVPVTLVLATPTFLIASLLVWLGAVKLGLFPVAGHDAPLAWVLPDGTEIPCSGAEPGPAARLVVRDYRFIRRCLADSTLRVVTLTTEEEGVALATPPLIGAPPG